MEYLLVALGVYVVVGVFLKITKNEGKSAKYEGEYSSSHESDD